MSDTRIEITDRMVEAAAREAWRIGSELFGSSQWENQSEGTRERVLSDQRRVLTAALAVHDKRRSEA